MRNNWGHTKRATLMSIQRVDESWRWRGQRNSAQSAQSADDEASFTGPDGHGQHPGHGQLELGIVGAEHRLMFRVAVWARSVRRRGEHWGRCGRRIRPREPLDCCAAPPLASSVWGRILLYSVCRRRWDSVVSVGQLVEALGSFKETVYKSGVILTMQVRELLVLSGCHNIGRSSYIRGGSRCRRMHAVTRHSLLGQSDAPKFSPEYPFLVPNPTHRPVDQWSKPARSVCSEAHPPGDAAKRFHSHLPTCVRSPPSGQLAAMNHCPAQAEWVPAGG